MDADLQMMIDGMAHQLLGIGQSVIPIGSNKRPAIEWKQYYDKAMGVESWNYPDCNLGIVTGLISKVVVVDCDSDRSVLGWLRSKPLTPLRVKSRRGMHFYYQHPGQYVKSNSHIKDGAGFEYDVKGDRSYVVLPPSFRSGHQYQVVPCGDNALGKWLAPEKLPVFDLAWRPNNSGESASSGDKKISDGVAYIKHIVANEGSGGDKATYRAAMALMASGMDQAEALVALLEWNETNAKPKWSQRDLYRKIQSVYFGVS